MFAATTRLVFRSVVTLLACLLIATLIGISPGGAQGGAAPGPAAEQGGSGSNFLPNASPTFRLSPLDTRNLDLPDGVMPGLSSFARPGAGGPLAGQPGGDITLSAHLTEGADEIPAGIVWRIFSPQPDIEGKLPLIASARGGTHAFHLPAGRYLVHAAFGRAGATKRIKVGEEPAREDLVLDAGGMKLNAVLSGGVKIPPARLRFSIYEAAPDAAGDRALVIPDVKPDTIVRLKAGTYHVVSTYGAVNAVIRADIRVEAGKLIQATVEHRAAHLTMKLVREHGGEGIADTAWSVLSDNGDVVKETVGAFASMVLAEGDYVIIAKNRDRLYQRDFTVVAGKNQEVELLPADQVDETGARDVVED